MFQKLLKLIKAHKIISAIGIAIVIFGSFQWYQKSHSTSGAVQYITGPAQKTTITVSISGTGQISAQNKIDLKPGGSGQSAAQITQVFVKQGDQVKAGQVIATVDEKNNNVALIQARASLQSAQASYDKLMAGLNNIDLKAAQLAVTSAQNNYDNTVIQQQQAVDKALSSFLNSNLEAAPDNSATSTTIAISGNYSEKTEGSYKIHTYLTGDGLYYGVSGLGNDNGPLYVGLPRPIGNGLYITFSTTQTYTTYNSWTVEVPNSKSTSYLSNKYAYESALQSQTQAINSAQNSLASAQLAYQSKTQSPADADVSSAKAQIAQAQASLATAEVNYDNNIIKSPFDGQVAALNNQVGDQVTSSTVVATVITNQKLAIMPLNEVDAAKVQVGQKANLTFDALDGLNIVGQVAQIDTIGTVNQGVVTYNTKIAFDSQDVRIKPGMSVSAAIITNVKTDVLSVPSSAVKSNTNGSYVQILDASGKPQNKTVGVGISNDSDTEITSGLNEGDMVVTQTINPTAASATTRATTTIPGLGGGGGARFRTGN